MIFTGITEGGMSKFRFASSFALAVALLCAGAALADPIPKGWEAQNLRPIGFSGLDGRYGAFKLTTTSSAYFSIRASDHYLDLRAKTQPRRLFLTVRSSKRGIALLIDIDVSNRDSALYSISPTPG